MSWIRALELAAFRAWPAEVVMQHGALRLRATRGVTRRANSAWVHPDATEEELRETGLVDAIEEFYASHRLPPRVQVPSVGPGLAIDALLEERGYRIEAPVSIATAGVPRVLDACRKSLERNTVPDPNASTAGEWTTVAHTSPVESWFEVSARRGRFRDVPDVYAGILERIETPHWFLTVAQGEQIAGATLLVIENDWAGIFGMTVLEEHRRRGAGRRLLQAAAETAAQHGARSLYLQVEQGNDAAGALYASAGFRHSYGYYYRVSEQLRR